ncbi:hypothetical protein AGABI2DRAFT_119981 [Agaricus bisporus var. bisporus H97]|uniref:hypothetical protein n=1 Tax=Agaricus bisporus var. bisporus (strain H97 / ATCC MYA-4626 / FGSC 10389) TaxID=936046 RepID=UPI00029F6DED|nr:hypothetical protein AGABI2DRAFT_119981 [Agaricus bisporus var. bisporus H97]EKV45008.1 hypothetical protein AGABI2DRAFT_119981 [Agaricus bisporus var. bisporus H97]
MSVTGADSDSAPPTLNFDERGDQESEEGIYHLDSGSEWNSEEPDEDEHINHPVIQKKEKCGGYASLRTESPSPWDVENPAHKSRGTTSNMKKRKASEDLHESPSDVDATEALETTRPLEVSEQSKTYTKTAEQASKRSKVAGALGGLKAGWKTLKTVNLGSKKPGQ